jgi:urease subunit gamma/beta
MYLSPTEHDRLLVFLAAELARRTMSHGHHLSAPEAVAIICDRMHEAARSGATYEDVVASGMTALRASDVLEGVPELVAEIRLEVLLGDGSRLIVLRNPLGPSVEGAAAESVMLSRGRRRIDLEVTSQSRLPIRVASHFPFWLCNRRLVFDREAAQGFHLDVAAGASLRWEPGQTRRVALVAYGGQQTST